MHARSCICVLVASIYIATNTLAFNDMLRNDLFHIYRKMAVEIRNLQNRPVTEDKVTYSLFTKLHTNEYVILDPENLDILHNLRDKIVFLIHGWTDNRESDWYENSKNALLFFKDGIDAVIQVDWSDPANQFYYVSSINTYEVAEFISRVIVDLNQKQNIPLENFILIGHSLGGQIAGFVGEFISEKLAGQRLPRIIALDPAGPLFDTRPADKRLNKTSADVVQVIHTNGGIFGYKDSIGTIDFFVNGGTSQPGCRKIDLADLVGTISEPLLCDHRRAYEYYVEALLNPTEFVAKKCANWEAYQNNSCDMVEVALGDLETTAEGDFYLETNNEKPFARKKSDSGGFSLMNLIPF